MGCGGDGHHRRDDACTGRLVTLRFATRQVGDIIVTPMGMEVTVVGVKKSPYDLYYQ